MGSQHPFDVCVFYQYTVSLDKVVASIGKRKTVLPSEHLQAFDFFKIVTIARGEWGKDSGERGL